MVTLTTNLAFHQVASLRLNRSHATHVAVFGSYAAVAAASSNTLDHPNSVWVAKLSGGQFRQVATSGFGSQGLVDWVEGTGSWLVFTDESREPDDQNPSVSWQIRAVNVISGKQFTLARSGSPSPVVPVPRTGDGYVVWSQLVNVSAGANLHLYDLGRRRDTVIVQGERASSFGVTNGRVVFDDVSTSDSGQQMRDVYSVDLQGGNRRRLSRSGQAVLPRAGGGNVVWQEPLNADPARLVLAGASGVSGPTVVTSSPGLGNAVTADGIVYFLSSSGGVNAVRSGRAATQVSPVVSVPLRISADMKLIAYGLIAGAGSPSEYAVITVKQLAP